jgi:hypothetical protein
MLAKVLAVFARVPFESHDSFRLEGKELPVGVAVVNIFVRTHGSRQTAQLALQLQRFVQSRLRIASNGGRFWTKLALQRFTNLASRLSLASRIGR